jgi:hypothetical protein
VAGPRRHRTGFPFQTSITRCPSTCDDYAIVKDGDTLRPLTDSVNESERRAQIDGAGHGRADFAATGSEWRTPPLWGIGLTQVVTGRNEFLHDGRARSGQPIR